MLSFRHKQFVPPGGKWFYKVPETGVYFEDYGSYLALERKVKDHYIANSREVPQGLRDLIEHYICLAVPTGFCVGDDPRGNNAPKRLDFFSVTDRVEKFFRGRHRPYATVKIAGDRATRCITCPNNSLGLCTSCSGLRQTARSFVGGRRLNQDSYLGVCKAFLLPLNALVHVELQEGDIPEGLPGNCWVEGAVK